MVKPRSKKEQPIAAFHMDEEKRNIALAFWRGEKKGSICERFEITRPTLDRWIEQMSFQDYLAELEAAYMQTVNSKIHALAEKAVDTLDKLLGSEVDEVARKTAFGVLEHLKPQRTGGKPSSTLESLIALLLKHPKADLIAVQHSLEAPGK